LSSALVVRGRDLVLPAGILRDGVVVSVRMASLTPAERAGIADEVGSLEAGKRADALLLSPELAVERVFIGGVELGPSPTTRNEIGENPPARKTSLREG
jgi:cytosine/adenosine deaminase-related metal-dependent hydrolase